MVSLFQDFIKKHALIEPEEKVILAVSGGLDSMVMLELFSKTDFTFCIAHCDFQLRGEASDGDRQFVENYARVKNISCYIERFDTPKISVEQGISIEMAARNLRYEWFNRLRSELSYDWIATAHHQNDVVETMLYNLVRGTGISGLHGILAKRNQIIRPLLFAARDLLLDYAKKEGIEWREDQSNLSLLPHRNKIRHEVIPVMKSINPSLEKTVVRAAARIADAENIINKRLEEVKKDYCYWQGKDYYIDFTGIKTLEAPLYFLFSFLQPFGFNEQQSEMIQDIPDDQSGKIFLSKDYVLNVDRHLLIISSNEKPLKHSLIAKHDNFFVYAGLEFETSIFQRDYYTITGNPKCGAFDLAKLKFPLIIRSWQSGDYFYPLGMKHKKKISDYMIDTKIPVNLKKRYPVILSEGEVIWLAGLRIDDRYKIDHYTSQVYEIKISEND